MSFIAKFQKKFNTYEKNISILTYNKWIKVKGIHNITTNLIYLIQIIDILLLYIINFCLRQFESKQYHESGVSPNTAHSFDDDEFGYGFVIIFVVPLGWIRLWKMIFCTAGRTFRTRLCMLLYSEDFCALVMFFFPTLTSS